MKHFVLSSLIILPILVGLFSCNGKVKTPQVADADSLSQADSSSYTIEEQPQASLSDVSLQPMKSHLMYRLISKDFDENDTTYNESTIEIQWPLSVLDYPIQGLQKSLIKTFFGKDYKSISDAWKSVATISEPEAKRLNAMPTDIRSYQQRASSSKAVLQRVWNNIVTYDINYYDYEGGAHGSYSRGYFHYDLTSQTPVDGTTIFASSRKKDVLNLIATQFMHLKGAKSKSQLSEMGYDFSEIKEIPQFDFNATQFTFVFQPYEIACYAEGMPKIVIPVQKLAPYFSDLGKSLFLTSSQME